MKGNVNLSANLVIIEFFSRFSPGFLGILILFFYFIQVLLILNIEINDIFSRVESLKAYSNLILVSMFFVSYFFGTIIKEIFFQFLSTKSNCEFPYLSDIKIVLNEIFKTRNESNSEIINWYESKFIDWGKGKKFDLKKVDKEKNKFFKLSKDYYYFNYCKNELEVLSHKRAEYLLSKDALIRFFQTIQALFAITGIIALIFLFILISSLFFSYIHIKYEIILIGINLIILIFSIGIYKLMPKSIKDRSYMKSLALWIHYYELNKTSIAPSTSKE